jgi:diadenosine tetraphosphate (Ap4A) HIT family hydrolase
LETDKTLAFLDINPLSQGHAVRFHVYDHHLSLGQAIDITLRFYSL